MDEGTKSLRSDERSKRRGKEGFAVKTNKIHGFTVVLIDVKPVDLEDHQAFKRT